MSAELHVHSDRPPVSWETFTHTPTVYPLGSIALDGFVIGPPKFTSGYYNANHHEGVDRLATLSTAQQIHRSFQMGFTEQFQRNGEFGADVYVNDCDQDVCAAWYLLEHPTLAETANDYSLNRFINVAGTLDVTSGGFPYNRDLKILKELAWVFEPYDEFRASGEMVLKDNEQYEDTIRTVVSRIGKHLSGRGSESLLDLRYKTIGGGQSWAMIEAIGKDGRVGAIRDGIKAYVVVQELENNRWRYSLGRQSEFVNFPITALLIALNDAEGTPDNPWGGATTTAGSPRTSGSTLSPTQVQLIISSIVTK